MPPLLQVLASVLVPPLALLILIAARGERCGMVHNAMASETDPPGKAES